MPHQQHQQHLVQQITCEAADHRSTWQVHVHHRGMSLPRGRCTAPAVVVPGLMNIQIPLNCIWETKKTSARYRDVFAADTLSALELAQPVTVAKLCSIYP